MNSSTFLFILFSRRVSFKRSSCLVWEGSSIKSSTIKFCHLEPISFLLLRLLSEIKFEMSLRKVLSWVRKSLSSRKMITASSVSSLDYESATNDNSSLFQYSTIESYDNATSETINYCPYVKSPISNMILVILYSVVCIVGIVGNSLVIFVVLKFKWVKTKAIMTSVLVAALENSSRMQAWWVSVPTWNVPWGTFIGGVIRPSLIGQSLIKKPMTRSP